MNTYEFWAIILLILGFGFLILEILIPSGGILGTTTAVLMVSSIFCAWTAWYSKTPIAFWAFLAILAAGIPASIFGALKALPYTPLANTVLLKPPRAEELTPFQNEISKLRELIGQLGTTVTVLNPSGIVIVAGERLQALTQGMMIAAQASVVVIDVRGVNLIVREASEAEQQSLTRRPPQPEDPFDFDIPDEQHNS
jgi:membrane-bound serine protease (ClpP class)